MLRVWSEYSMRVEQSAVGAGRASCAFRRSPTCATIERRGLETRPLEPVLGPRDAVKDFGRTPFSFNCLEEPHRYDWHRCESVDGFVPYVRVGRTNIVIGEPLVAEDDIAAAWSEFTAASRQRGRRPFGFMVTQALRDAAVEFGAVTVCQLAEPRVDPSTWTRSGRRKRNLRNGLSKMRRADVVADAAFAGSGGPSLDVRAAANRLVDDWLSEGVRHRGHIHGVNAWHNVDEKSYFWVLDPNDSGRMLALLIARPIYGNDGWCMHLIRRPGVPDGPAELAAVTAFEVFGNKGVQYATFGPYASPAVSECANAGRMSEHILTSVHEKAVTNGGHANVARYYRRFDAELRPTYNVFASPGAIAPSLIAAATLTETFPRWVGALVRAIRV